VITEPTYVCTACGSPACWAGEFMCDNAFHANVAPCTCDWGDEGRGWAPLVVDPACYIHGEVP